MPLQKAESIIPTRIGDISVVLVEHIAVDEEPAKKEALFEVQVLNADDEVMKLARGDLVPHLTTQQKQMLLGFMDELRSKAEAEILP